MNRIGLNAQALPAEAGIKKKGGAAEYRIIGRQINISTGAVLARQTKGGPICMNPPILPVL